MDMPIGKVKDGLALTEKVLIRWISSERYTNEARHSDFGILSEWPKANECLLTTRAIVTCALDSGSILYKQAHEWINAQENKSLIVAVGLLEANYDPNMKHKVLVEIFDHHGFNLLPESAYEIWKNIGRGQKFSWSEIAKAVNLKNWQLAPPNSRPELFDASRRVLENPSASTRRELALDFFNLSYLEKMPNLRRAMITEFITDDKNPVLGKVCENIELFRNEVVGILLNFASDSFVRQINLGTHESLLVLSWLYDLAQVFSQRIKSISQKEQTLFIEKMTDEDESAPPWLWFVAKRLFEGKIPEKKKIALLLEWTDFSNFMWLRIDFQNFRKMMPNAADRIFQQIRGDFVSVFESLPVWEKKEFMDRIFKSENPKRFFEIYPQEDFLAKISRSPEDFQAICSGIISGSKVDLDFVISYIDACKAELIQKDILHWCQLYRKPEFKYLDAESIDSVFLEKVKKLVQFANEYDIPLDSTLSQNPEAFSSLGYRLKPEDLIGVNIVQILCDSHQIPKVTSIWKNKQWRKVMFANDSGLDIVIGSILTTANRTFQDRSNAVVWLEEILIPACEQYPCLKQALIEYAWNSKNQYDNVWLAQELLAKKREWITDDDQPKIFGFFMETAKKEETLSDHYGPAEVFLTLVERRDLFFDSILEKKKPIQSLLFPKNYQKLFADQIEIQRLTNWLVINAHLIAYDSWLEWVKFYGLQNDKKIKKHLRKILDSEGKEVVALAIELLSK